MRSSARYSAGIKKFLWDVSGAFGDIGVLFPLAVALIAKNGFNPTALFLAAGIFYAVSAWYFKISMPVQPMKAMSAVALATGLSFVTISAAGVLMGVILVLIAVTGWSDRLGRFFPVSVIRGIQLGLGAMLVKSSIPLVSGDLAVGIIAAAVLAANVALIKKIPPLIPLLLLGVAFSLKGADLHALGPVALHPALPGADDLWKGLVLLVLPQIALTFGNAIVATEATGKLLYHDKAKRLTLRSIPLSMGIANIASGIAGGAPMCHGCGGLTAHNKFGATDQRSGYIIGFALIAIALLFGRSTVALVSAFPSGILGVLLCYVGIQHSLFVKDILHDRKAVAVAFTVAMIGFASGNLTWGFLAGLSVHYGYEGIKKIARAGGDYVR